MEDTTLNATPQGANSPVDVVLKDVLCVPPPLCRLLGIDAVRRDSGEFVESGEQASHIRVRKSTPKIALVERISFLMLEGVAGKC